MASPCTNNPDEVVDKVVSVKTDADKFNKFVNGTATETVQLGSGDPTPVIRNIVSQIDALKARSEQAVEDALSDAGDIVEWVKDQVAEVPSGDVSLNNAKALGGSVSRTLAERFADIASVIDYGAAGDGATDDEAAFAAAEATGAPVAVPADTYLVDGETASVDNQLSSCDTQTDSDSSALRAVYERAVQARHRLEDLRWKTIGRHVDYDEEDDPNKDAVLAKDPAFPGVSSPVWWSQRDVNDLRGETLQIMVRDMVRAEVERASGGRRTVVRGAGGFPNVMYVLPKFRLRDVGIHADGWHPAFIVGGKVVGEVLIGCYEASLVGGYAVSRHGGVPVTRMYAGRMDAMGREAGDGFHVMTAAEWGALALFCAKSGFLPRGNDVFGKCGSHPWESGRLAAGWMPTGDYVPSEAWGGENEAYYYPTLAGSGPLSWNHNGSADGIADVVGNVSEYTPGLCLKYGEIQVIENNDAALSTVDVSDSSALWRAIKVDGTLVESTISVITVSGHAVVEYSNSNSLKINCIDWDSEEGGTAQIDTAITQYSDPDKLDAGVATGVYTTGKYATVEEFKNLTRNTANIADEPALLQALAMYPVADASLPYQAGKFYSRNWMPHDVMHRCGNWYWGSDRIGMFAASLTNRPNVMGYNVTFRLAHVGI